ncbi:hypothetical protein DK842_01940 [Chromobacterium phragmitis]|uniref:substrate-binding domain-containing protein n=1 Tax=Chromobacterium phragmitis TaxID=2202141 RepID=UPI000DED30A9|nr:substrate-binding domain-containing protein [Chromobacterium phragmitis]AXE28785.1 hypothetical protein DK842_01940 [Chromobacterium phragmitis]
MSLARLWHRFAAAPLKWRLLPLPAALALLALASSPWWRTPMAPALTLAGASQLQSLLAELGAAYEAGRGKLLVEGGGSVASLIAARRGVIDLAAVSQRLPDWQDEADLHYHLLARNSIAFIVNRASPLRALARRQLREALTGDIRNWRALGGPDAPIRLLTRTEPSSARQFVEEVVLEHHEFSGLAEPLDSAARMLATVESDPLALGYLSMQKTELDKRVALLAIDGVAFSRATILSGRYPYVQDLYLAYQDDAAGRVRPLLDWLKTPPAQEAIERHQLIAVY